MKMELLVQSRATFHPREIPRVGNPCCASLQVTVMHSMQAGYLEKAQKYTDKALMQLEKLKSKEKGLEFSWNPGKFHHLFLV